jgi:phage shock protein PspC (stress-responsive transcriptional regulator)
MIIESNSSYHLYWFAKDGTKENWNKVCNGLRNYFDGDPAVVDISRVLRLP